MVGEHVVEMGTYFDPQEEDIYRQGKTGARIMPSNLVGTVFLHNLPCETCIGGRPGGDRWVNKTGVQLPAFRIKGLALCSRVIEIPPSLKRPSSDTIRNRLTEADFSIHDVMHWEGVRDLWRESVQRREQSGVSVRCKVSRIL